MSPSRSGSAIGAGGGSRQSIATRTLYPRPMSVNANLASAPSFGLAERIEMEARLRRFLADFSDHCLKTVPVEQRTERLSCWLSDAKRPDGNRHKRFIEQMADLIELSGKAERPAVLAEGILAESLRLVPTETSCPETLHSTTVREFAEASVAVVRFLVSRTATWRDAAVKEVADAINVLRRLSYSLHKSRTA
jgi:hypothetical protein